MLTKWQVLCEIWGSVNDQNAFGPCRCEKYVLCGLCTGLKNEVFDDKKQKSLKTVKSMRKQIIR